MLREEFEGSHAVRIFSDVAVSMVASGNRFRRLADACGAEFAGSSLFLFIVISTVSNYDNGIHGPYTSAQDPLNIAVVFGGTIGVLVYAIADVSGANLNPAVSIALALRGSISALTAALYIISQVLGAIVGALLARACADSALYSSHPGVNYVGAGHHLWQALLAEIIATSLLCSVVLYVTDKRRVMHGHAAIAIGGAILVCHLALIPIDGTSINPARSIGAAVAAWNRGPNKKWDDLWVFIVGPVIGGVLPGVFWRCATEDDICIEEPELHMAQEQIV
jgi:MIP family channel proteins